jgi:prepilin-type N-terminal cleavage/methylation domain-containing protein
MNPSRTGFSLVELSIVLVILGLLTGGILGGQSLIRAAELRSVSTQFNSYVAATQTFRDKYFGLPGDLNNAQTFWGVAHATPATCVTTAGTGTQTCNGNNDGQIAVSTGSNEMFRYWQHLANAGLIEGSYDGIPHGSSASFTAATTRANAPVGKLSNSIWYITHMGTQSGNTVWFDGIYGNTYQFGGIYPDYDPATPIFKPEEAWNIDTKMDDGKPAQGKLVVRAQNGFNTCTTGATASATGADYLLTATSATCTLMFRQLF